jgi:recombinational DNA repair ATPase RecF
MSTVATPRSARDLLVDWANRQDHWVRAIVGEALLSRRDLASTAITRITESFLTEKQLADGDPIEVPLLGDEGGTQATSQALSLISLRNCRGVNALAEDQAIEFNDKMTILFGENATGKTGYVRVLKRVANVRSAEQIIPDIHRATQAPDLQAILRYAVDGDEADLEWAGETGVPPLTRMSVFDAPAVALHLEDNVTYVYTPPDLALFPYVHTAIEAVRSELEKQRIERQPRHNPFMTAFTRDTPIYPKIEQLGATTDLPELERLATVGEAERAEVDTLKLSVEALSADSTSGHSEMLRNRVAALRSLLELTSSADGFKSHDACATTTELRNARRAQDNAASAVFAGGELPAAIRPAWQAFVEAGDHYLHSRGMDSYPRPDDPCIYCQQPLAPPAIALVQSYREYASGAAGAAVATASAKVDMARAPLVTAKVDNALANLHSLLPAMEEGDNPPDWVAEGRLLAEAIRAARQHFQSEDDSPVPDVRVPGTLAGRLTSALTDAQAALQGVEGDAQARRTLLSEHRVRLATLEARMTLARLLPEIRTYVANEAWASRLKLLLGRFQGLLKGLTDVSKTASNQVLNQSFRQAFEEECRSLRAPNVELGFPGRRGQAARRKSVASDHSLTEVLSEGEQKVIAVADFLAEASFRGGSAPLVFDDPVTSLDHRRLHEMVRRIAALSDAHQVVVFTHNVWFASELLARFDDREKDCSFYQVTERAGAKGVITGGVHPRIDTPAKIRGRINKGIQEAKAAGNDERTALVEGTYDHVRAWCEAIVERDLLAQVTRRYQPNVAMQNLERIKPERLSAAIAVILPIYERACRYIPGHSQPIETLDVRPSLEEIEADWEKLQDAHKLYGS